MKCIPKLQGYFSFEEDTAGSFNLNIHIWPVKYFKKSLMEEKSAFNIQWKFLSCISPSSLNVVASLVLEVKPEDNYRPEENDSHLFSKPSLILC